MFETHVLAIADRAVGVHRRHALGQKGEQERLATDIQIPLGLGNGAGVDTTLSRIWLLRRPYLVYIRVSNFIFGVNTGLFVTPSPGLGSCTQALYIKTT